MENLYKTNKISYAKIGGSLIEQFVTEYKNYDILYGPNNINVVTIQNKLVIFLDDKHVKINNDYECYDKDNQFNTCWIDDFFSDLFEISPTCIDFFIETTLFQQVGKQNNLLPITKHIEKESKGKYNDGLFRIQQKFIHCVGPLKKECSKYKYTRFHNIEYRRFGNNFYDIVGGIFCAPLAYLSCPIDTKCFFMPQFLFKYKEKNMIPERLDENMKIHTENLSENLNSIFNGLLAGDMDIISTSVNKLYSCFTNNLDFLDIIIQKFTPDQLNKNYVYTKLNAQIKKLPSSIQIKYLEEMKENYDRYMTFEITQIKDLFNEMMDEKSEKTYGEDFFISYRKMIFNFGVVVFDAYALARILKAFYVYQDSSIIIVYAGSGHTSFYNRALSSIMDTTPILTIPSETYEKSACVMLNAEKIGWNQFMDILKEKLVNGKKCTVRNEYKESHD